MAGPDECERAPLADPLADHPGNSLLRDHPGNRLPDPFRRLESALKNRATTDGEVVSLMNLLADALHEARHQTCACGAAPLDAEGQRVLERITDAAATMLDAEEFTSANERRLISAVSAAKGYLMNADHEGAAPRPHEHHWVGPDQFSPVDYCGICSVPRQHQHHVHENRAVSDCPDCIEAATAFLSEGAAPRAEGLGVDRLVRAVHRVDHGGDFDTCLRPDDDRHRAGLIAAFYARSRPSDERVPESEER